MPCGVKEAGGVYRPRYPQESPFYQFFCHGKRALEKAGWVCRSLRQERRQTEVIEKILRHCGLWEEQAARAPPSAKVPVTG